MKSKTMHAGSHILSAFLVMATAVAGLAGGIAQPARVAYAATITVNTTADNLTAGDGKCTLREAIRNANADADTTSGDCPAGSGVDQINLPAGVYHACHPRQRR